MKRIQVAVVGAGAFGRHHARVLSTLAGVRLAAIVDSDLARAQHLAAEHPAGGEHAGEEPVAALASVEDAIGRIDAAVVATPTQTHEAVASRLIEAGVDVLVEKPIADSSAAGERLTQLAAAYARVLQVGHLERFNPAVVALEHALTVPLFFEVHRLSVFTPRSLDVDVVLDLMIHDLDIVLHLTREQPAEIRAAGISVLSPKVDIANVRLAFPSGCVANLTASRVSTEKVRKLRLFQPNQYISLDYARQDASAFAVRAPDPAAPGALPEIDFKRLPVESAEPLERELASFIGAVRERTAPRVDGLQATQALRIAEAILAKIEEHAAIVSETVRRKA